MSSPVIDHFNLIAQNYDYYKKKNSFYYLNLKKLLRSLIPKNKVVLEIGCGTGDLLVSLTPRIGYGIDISEEMIKIAKRKYSDKTNLHFSTSSISKFKGKKIDYIFMCDVVEHLPDPAVVFKEISKIMTKDTVLINTMANPIWEPVLMAAEKLKLKMPEGDHNRWSFFTLTKIIRQARMSITFHNYCLLIPGNIPFVTNFANKYLEPYLKRFAFIEYFQAIKSKK